jgi:hypothetical protein
LERHLPDCAACAELVADSRSAMGFMERAAEVEPPPELVNRILFAESWKQHTRPGVRHWFQRLVQPVLQPKLAMGMAMTILTLAMLAKYVAPSRQLRPDDFNPVRVWQALDDRIYRGYQRTVKFYESIKFVYQVRARLQEFNEQQDEEQAAAAERKQNRAVDEKRLPVNGNANAPAPQNK